MSKHTANLRRIFPGIGRMGNATLETELRKLERRGARLARDYCNRPLEEGEPERREESILNDLDAILDFRKSKVPVFLNLDPRGYALKIDDDWVRKNNVAIERDWGGYGIICPEEEWK